MVVIKTAEQIEKIRESSRIVGLVHQELKNIISPGVTTKRLEVISEEIIRDNKGEPSFKGYKGYPHSICASINEEIVHGFPSDRILHNGDVLSVDVGVVKEGYHGDAAFSAGIGEVSSTVIHLLATANECLSTAIRLARDGVNTKELGIAIQRHADTLGFDIVRNYVGHGIGRELHEYPPIYNYGKDGGVNLKAGMTICIEPMLTVGKSDNETLSDGWTVVTKSRELSAHVEHTILITTDQPEILTI